MFQGLAYVHGLLFRLCLWLLRQPFKALWVAILGVLALLGEEARRWAGLLMAWLLVIGAGKATLNYAPASLKKELALAILAFLVLLAFATRRALRITAQNDTVKVRTRKSFKDLQQNAAKAAQGAHGTVVRKTRGTAVEGVFSANRSARAEERAAAEQAAEQAATEQRRSQAAAEDDERHRDYLASIEPDPFQ